MGMPPQPPRIAFLLVQRQQSALEHTPILIQNVPDRVTKCSPRHTHAVSLGSYMGLQYILFLAVEDSTDYLPWKDVAIFVSCSLPFTY